MRLPLDESVRGVVVAPPPTLHVVLCSPDGRPQAREDGFRTDAEAIAWATAKRLELLEEARAFAPASWSGPWELRIYG